MKLFNLFTILILLSGLSSCSLYAPTYFGAKYPPTNTVKSYYSINDINVPFEVMGHMNARTGQSEANQIETRRVVILKAKEIGADGVVFSEINRQVNQTTTDDFFIKVQVIKFK